MKVTEKTDRRDRDYELGTCPTWCSGEHLGRADDMDGFHHDGPMTIILVEQPATERGGGNLYVNVSLHEQTGMTAERSYVEVQDESQTIALLTPIECLGLSRALLEAAAAVANEDERQLDHIRRVHLVQELEETLVDGWVPLVGQVGST
jgi:hypothetical protein